MSKKTYEIIPVTKAVDGKALLDNLVIYLYSRLKECQLETNISGNTYTILASSTSKRKQDRAAYLTVEIILHEDSCAVYFASSKNRPVINMVFAIAAAPVALPVAGLLAGSGLLHLLNHKEFKKDVIRYIETYVNQ